MRSFLRALIPLLFVAILCRSVGLSFASPTIAIQNSTHASLVQGSTSPAAPIQDPAQPDFQKVRRHHRRFRKQLAKVFVALPLTNHFSPAQDGATTALLAQAPPSLISIDTLSRPPCC